MQGKIVWFLATWLLNSFFFQNLVIASSSEKSSKLSNKEAYAELKKTIASLRKSCGEVCDQTITGKPGKYFDEITKNIDCPGLFSDVGMDLPTQFESAPSRIPKWLRDDFGYHGKVELLQDYRDTSKGQHHWHFTKEVIEKIQNELDNNTFIGPYGQRDTHMVYHLMKQLDIRDKHVLVIGSETPWIEVMALHHRLAKKVTTVDYHKMKCEDPRIDLIHSTDFNKMFLKNQLPEFDAIISFSSLEHSGLGRYGDTLNPWGDLITMARAWCVLKPGGRALIGIPIGPGVDRIYFNSHKLYGPLMLSHLFSNWKQISSDLNYDLFSDDCIPCYQEIFIVEK